MSVEPMSKPDAACGHLLSKLDDHVLVLTLNRPERRNALTPALIDDLLRAFVSANLDPQVRAIVVTGAGDLSFCAGFDLKARNQADHDAEPFIPFTANVERYLFEAVLETQKPVIAALNGPAVAGGLELALACDIRIAADHISFGLPEAKRGMGAHFATVILPRLVPPAIAYEMLYTGEYFAAQDGLRWGLFNKVTPKADLLAAAMQLAQTIARNAPLSLRRMKATVTKSSGMTFAAAIRLDEGPSPYTSEDRQEGIAAFVEKRAPVWKGR